MTNAPLALAVTTSSLAPSLDEAVGLVNGNTVRGLVVDARNELRAGSLGETGRRQFLKRLDDRGLRIAALSFPTRRPLFDQADLDARIDAIRGAMQFAAELRAPLVLVRPGRIPDAESPESEVLHAVLSDLARFGTRIGTALALSPGNNSPETLQSTCNAVTAGLVGIDLDPAALVLAGHDPATAVRTLHDRLLHVRLRDAVRDVDASGLEVPVGRGEVDWLMLLATLGEVGYTRWHTADRTTGNDRPGDALRALEYVRNVLPG